jgi:hypothetical protein
MTVPLDGASPESGLNSLSRDPLDEDLDLSSSQWSKIEAMWSFIKVSSSSNLGIHSFEEVVGYEVLAFYRGGLIS